MAVSETTIAVGAPDATVNGNYRQGAVYVFTRAGGTWHQAAKLTASGGAGGNQLGTSVAVCGTTIAAGAPYATVNGNIEQGAVYVFTRAWRHLAPGRQAHRLRRCRRRRPGLVGGGLGDHHRRRASDATVGGNAFQGAVYVFTEPASGWRTRPGPPSSPPPTAQRAASWAPRWRSRGPPSPPGALGATVNGNNGKGAVYVFTEPASGWADETQTAELTADDGVSGDWLGSSVAVSGTIIAALARMVPPSTGTAVRARCMAVHRTRQRVGR